jgi:hypothetical protein
MGGGNLGFSALQYNGNIAGMIWRNESDGVQKVWRRLRIRVIFNGFQEL